MPADPLVVTAVERRRQAEMGRAGLLPEPRLLSPIRIAARAHRDPDLDPVRFGSRSGRLARPRSWPRTSRAVWFGGLAFGLPALANLAMRSKVRSTWPPNHTGTLPEAGRGLMPASSIVCQRPLKATCGAAHNFCIT